MCRKVIVPTKPTRPIPTATLWPVHLSILYFWLHILIYIAYPFFSQTIAYFLFCICSLGHSFFFKFGPKIYGLNTKCENDPSKPDRLIGHAKIKAVRSKAINRSTPVSHISKSTMSIWFGKWSKNQTMPTPPRNRQRKIEPIESRYLPRCRSHNKKCFAKKIMLPAKQTTLFLQI